VVRRKKSNSQPVVTTVQIKKIVNEKKILLKEESWRIRALQGVKTRMKKRARN